MAVLNLTIDRPMAQRSHAWRLAHRSCETPADRTAAAADQALCRALATAHRGAPLLFLLHGYRYDPHGALGDPKRDPHQAVLRPERAPPPRAPRSTPPSWPAALGFEGGFENGLAIGLGWASLPSQAERGIGARHPVAWAYRAAAQTAQCVADILRRAAVLRPDLPIDIYAHSFGARIAFLTLRIAAAQGWDRRIGRILALGAAEYRDTALRAARHCQSGGAEVISFVSRANDPYDAMMQVLGPRSALSPRSRPLGAGGLGRRTPGWIDLQIDHPELQPWLTEHGVSGCAGGRFCRHNAFYARPGMAALHRRILDERWGAEDLRRLGADEAIERRWARFAPLRLTDAPIPRRLAAGRARQKATQRA